MTEGLLGDDPGGNVETSESVPDGFELLTFRSGFLGLIAPLYSLQDEDVLRLGFRCGPHHCNAGGMLHGGMLACYADFILTCGAIYHARLQTSVITVNLSCDFVASAKPGDWIEGTVKVLRVTRSMVFVEGAVMVGDRQILRTSGVLKIGVPVRHRWIRRTEPQPS